MIIRLIQTIVFLLVLSVGSVVAAPAVDAQPVDETIVVADVYQDDFLGGLDDDILNDIDDDSWEDFEDDLNAEEYIVYDPYETFNRSMFVFNDKFYVYLFKPVVKVYRYVPKQGRAMISNFFFNIATPIRMVNSGLQLNGRDALNELIRFCINTTLGIGGLFDPAKKWFGIKAKEEDFGQTLGVYGVGPGAYLVLPFYGPTSVRDGLGDVVDTLFNPFYYEVEGDEDYFAIYSFELINTESLDKDSYENAKRASLDPYEFIKNSYSQNRAVYVAE